jgi:hypothetical protein
MRYIITENKLMDFMDKFFEKEHPEIELPLIKKKKTGRRHDDVYHNYFYFSQDQDNNNKPLFIEYSDDATRGSSKWSVNTKFYMIYSFFGKEAFEDFVKRKFDIDITKKGKRLNGWSFQ